jgi:hypothetical protein
MLRRLYAARLDRPIIGAKNFEQVLLGERWRACWGREPG